MARPRAERVVDVLTRLNTNTPDVEASALVSVEGLIMASVLPSGIDEERVAAICAAILGIAERSTHELDRGDLRRVLVQGSQGYVVLQGAGQEAVVAVLATKRAKLGMVFLDVGRAAAEIDAVLSKP